MNAEVHAHSAQRIVEMRRVAGQQHAAVPEAAGDALVHRIQIGVDDLELLVLPYQSFQTGMGGVKVEQFGFIVFQLRGKDGSPQPFRPRSGYLEDGAPFHRVRNIVGERISKLLVVEVAGNYEKPLGIREALEFEGL